MRCVLYVIYKEAIYKIDVIPVQRSAEREFSNTFDSARVSEYFVDLSSQAAAKKPQRHYHWREKEHEIFLHIILIDLFITCAAVYSVRTCSAI